MELDLSPRLHWCLPPPPATQFPLCTALGFAAKQAKKAAERVKYKFVMQEGVGRVNRVRCLLLRHLAEENRAGEII